MPLPPLPKDRRGVVMVGVRQARPLWALGPRCLWASDGSRPVFYRVSRDGAGRDSMVLPLQLPDPPTEDAEDVAYLSREAGDADEASFPEPTALWRVHDLLFDPVGRLWIRLNPKHLSDTAVAVAVLDPESGETVAFQAPAFPLVFGAAGVFYAVTRDSLGQPRMSRFAISSRAASSLAPSQP